MKRIVVLAGLIFCTACGDSGSEPRAPSSDGADAVASAPALAMESAAPEPTPAGRSEKVSTALYEFEYAYPAAAGAIPGLKAALDQRLDTARRELEQASKADEAEAKKSGFPYRPHSFGANWKVVTDLPGWLSLSADSYEYTGGAHGMSFFDSVLWDRRANAVRTPLDLFTSKGALSAAIREPFCAALDKEREKRRGRPVNRAGGDSFDECIDPVESTVILGSSNGRTFNRLGVLVGPYAAGPYAEGTFDITLPVTAAVLEAVKPAYRADFSAR